MGVLTETIGSELHHTRRHIAIQLGYQPGAEWDAANGGV